MVAVPVSVLIVIAAASVSAAPVFGGETFPKDKKIADFMSLNFRTEG